MATTIKQSFRDYSSNLEISNRQETLVGNCRDNVVEAIDKVLYLHSTQPSLVIGSWDRNTLTRYLSEGDIDVMVILHYDKNKNWYTSDGTISALDKFKQILTNAYPNTTIRRDENCITMQLSEFRLDVVPAFRFNDGTYKIPDSVRKRWITTNPIAFAKAVTAVNKKMDDDFVPLIKMVKGWNREEGWPIRSFHMECMMYHHYKSYDQSYTFDSTLKVFFNKLPTYLNQACYDPITSERVDLYLDNNAQTTLRDIAISKAKRAAEKSIEAYNDEEKYPITAIGEWKALLGEFFPTYG